MKKILLPIDGSPRSLRTIQVVKQSYIPAETEITILLVVPDPRPSKLTDENDEVTPMPDHEEITQDPQTKEEARLLVNPLPRCSPGIRRPPPCASAARDRRSSSSPRRAALTPS